MSLWREQLIPINPFSRPGIPLRLVRNIVVHYTANPGATAANHVGYFGETLVRQDPFDGEKDTYASAHLFIDPGDAVLLIPLNEQAHHASQANPYSIGVEMCIESDWSFHPETVRRTVQIVAELCKRYGLNPLRDVIRHFDVTGKICPKPYVDDPAAWEAFRHAVDRAMKGEVEQMAKSDGTLELELHEWRMLGDALTGMSKLPGGPDGDTLLAYEWAEKCYRQELRVDDAIKIILIGLARSLGVDVRQRDA